MKRLSLAITYMLPLALVAIGGAARAQAVDAADLRLLAIAERIQNANASLCDRLAPALGVALQSRDQFPPESDPGFAAPVAFAAVLPGSPLAESGIEAGAGLTAIEGVAITVQPGLEEMPLRDSAHAMLGQHSVGGPLRLTVIDQGQTREIELAPAAQCRALVEVLVTDGRAARSDGRVIQIGLELIAAATDEEVAAVFAHELAHSVLHHRDRLAGAGVRKGLGAEFGRDRQLNAEAESEADRLSVHLLANAGYDPRIAPALWRGALGRQLDAGLFRKQIYLSPEKRAEALEREIADYLSGGAPSWPGHLLAKR
jgi:Zn-dependent protease with chaperone function